MGAESGRGALARQLREAFRERFGRSPDLGARAPGRVNLIGEHTDYNEGLVLPFAIDRDTVAWGASRTDGRVRVWARDLEAEAELAVSRPERRGDWSDYVAAPFAALAERGARGPGLDLAIASDVPRESGLSSSAALTVCVATLIDRAWRLDLGPRERARVAHRGESAFVGVGCGILDHFASALGRRDHALRIDCRTQEVEPVPLPGGHVRVLVADSGVRRALARGGYGDRVKECRDALEAARRAGVAPADATALRDLDPARPARLDALRSRLAELERCLPPELLRRARHVLTENARVDAFCEALARREWEAAGALLREGQRSLREDYEVSVAELDALCALGDAAPGVFGSRLTGAGFGGCTLHLVAPEAAERAAQVIAEGFEARFGRRPPVRAFRPSEGAGLLEA